MSGTSRFADGTLSQFVAVSGGLIALCIIAALLGALGVSGSALSILFILLMLVLCAVLSGNAAQSVPATSGVTFSIEALSAFGLFGIVGAVFTYGHDALVLVIGLAAGFVLSLLVVGPRYSTVAARSLPDFLGMRYSGAAIRYLALCVMAIVTVLFVAAQLAAAGLVAAQGLGVSSLVGVLVGALAILLVTVLAQNSAMTRGHIVLSTIAFVGCLIAAAWVLSARTGIFVPHLAYGGLFTDISAAENRLGLETHFDLPGEGFGLVAALSLVACLAVGSAVMPHLLARSSAQGSRAGTQHVLRSGLILFVVLATALPALGVLARVDVLALFTAQQNAVPFVNMLPSPLLHGAQACQMTAERMAEACTAQGLTEGLPLEEFRVDPQSVLLAVPALAQVSGWLRALLALVCLCVVTVAGAGAVRTLAAAFTDRPAEDDKQTNVAVAAFAITALAALVAMSGASLISLGAWAYSLIAASFVGPIIIGLSWPKTNTTGALAGLIGGFTMTALYIFGAQWGFDFEGDTGDEWLWFGIPPMMAGIFGIVLSMFLTVVLSLIGPKPKPSQVAFFGTRADPPVKANPEVLE